MKKIYEIFWRDQEKKEIINIYFDLIANIWYIMNILMDLGSRRFDYLHQNILILQLSFHTLYTVTIE